MPARPLSRLGSVARPVIAAIASLLPRSETPNRPSGHVAVSERYVEALQRAGARVVLLPAVAGGPDVPAGELLAGADGLCLIGGGDLDPAVYGQVRHERSYGFSAERDRVELVLARHAIGAGLPLLAICRGCQVVNVAMGGTLHQDLADVPGIDPGLHGRPHDLVTSAHVVTAEPGSLLSHIAGATSIEGCTCAHHQAVDRVGSGLTVTGRAPDGCVEAVEGSGTPGLVLAVQWHPELTAADDPLQQALFDAFAAAATARREAQERGYAQASSR